MSDPILPTSRIWQGLLRMAASALLCGGLASPAAAQQAPALETENPAPPATREAPAEAHEPQMGAAGFAPLPQAMADSVVARWVLVADRMTLGLTSPQATATLTMAMHDALNAAVPRFGRWTPRQAGEPQGGDADPVVAMSMAAFSVLATQHPVFVMRAEAEPLLREVLRGKAEGPLQAGIVLGGMIGGAAAARLARQPAVVPFPYGEVPGRWRPTPPVMVPGLVVLNVPILYGSRDALRGAPPPAIDTPRYRRDLDEVRRLGGVVSSERGAELAGIAEFWAAQSSQRGFLHLAIRLIEGAPRQGGAWEDARILSVLAVAMADGAVFAWEEKRHHAHWRPITAINAGSPGVVADPAWQPLLPTPAHPDYPSGHATDCGVGAVVLGDVFGSDFGPVDYIAMEPLQRPARRFATFDAAAEECAESRVWAGAHFRFANEEGLRIGRTVARRALERVPPLTAPR